MSIFAAPGFYNQGDQNIYNQDNRFFGERRYRLGDPINKNISFNTAGITNTAAASPFILPINQGGGGGGDGPGGGFNTDTEDQSTTADDFGSGLEGDDPSMNMTDEEKEAIDAYNNPATTKGMMGTIGATMFGFMNPITAMFSLNYQRNKAKEKAMEEAKQAAIEADFQREAAKGNSGADFTGGRYDGADTKSDYDSDPTGFSGSSKDGGIIGYGGVSGTPLYEQQFMYGGRVPYMMGGLASLADIYD